MSMPPPPQNPPNFQPPGYQPYGGPQTQQGNSGISVAGMVLSLVGIIPCFWALQVPGLLGLIFGFVGLGQTKEGGRKGRGMAIAAVAIGAVLLLICVAFWIAIAVDKDHCLEFGTSNICRD